MILSETSKRRTGDFEILFQEALSKPLSSDPNMRLNNNNTLAGLLSGSNPNARTSLPDLLDSLETLYPLLDISVPQLNNADLENWDIEQHTPWVAYRPIGLTDGKDEIIPAWDANGDYHELSSLDEPEHLVIVLKHNERVKVISHDSDYDSNLELYKMEGIDLPYFSDSKYDYFIPSVFSDIVYCDDCFGGGGGSTGGYNWSRNCGSGSAVGTDVEIKFYALRFDNISAYESWSAGRPEVKFNFFIPTGANAVRKESGYTNPKRSDIDRRWYVLDHNVRRWNLTNHGSAFAIVMVEDDIGVPDSDHYNYLNWYMGSTSYSKRYAVNMTTGDMLMVDYQFDRLCRAKEFSQSEVSWRMTFPSYW
jgi:hypothetical protein